MLTQNTVIVLGAAVSNELNLPLGAQLKEEISAILPNRQGSGNDTLRHVLWDGADGQKYQDATIALRRALPLAASIDNLVEHRGHDDAFKTVAKVGILSAILQAEHNSKIFDSSSVIAPLPTQVMNSTFASLFRLIFGSCGADKVGEALQRVAFVNFNYDRCLEQFFYQGLIHYSGLDRRRAAEIIAQMKVLHPYGWIGPLDWMAPANPAGSVRFGSSLGRVDVLKQASNIKTFSEERGSTDDDAIKEIMSEAIQVIFLGCAYHAQNIALIRPPECRFQSAFGTCYLPPPDDKFAKPDMASFAGPTAQAFRGALMGWQRVPGGTYLMEGQLHFEPLTSLQLVTKYGGQWVA